MLSNVLKLLSQWKDFKIILQNFKLYCTSFYFKVNDHFEGEVDESGNIFLKNANITVSEPIDFKFKKGGIINISENIELKGSLLLDCLILKNKNNELFNIYIDEERKLNKRC
jgi:hypothetical protein